MRALIVLIIATLTGISVTVMGGISGNKTFWQFMDMLPSRYILLLATLILLLYVLVAIGFHWVSPSGRRFVISAYSAFMCATMAIVVAVLVSSPLKSFAAKADGSTGTKVATAVGQAEFSLTTSQVDAATAQVGVHAIGVIGLITLLFCFMYIFASAWDGGRHPLTLAKLPT